MPHLRRRLSAGGGAALLALALGGGAAAQEGRAVIRVTLPVEPTAAAETAAAEPAAAPSDAASSDAASSDAALAALLPAEAAMVVLDTATGRHVRLNPEQAGRPLPPCSTFKIPNTLIALGAGAVTVDDHSMARDRERDPRTDFWPDAWDRDQDLPSALRRSTVWYYQELARRVGPAEMQRQLDRLGYGNRDVSGGIDRFWLGSSLLVSADEQVVFLRRLHGGELAFPEPHLALLREGLLQEEAGGRALYAKTGACTAAGSDDDWVGWWVGWVDRPEGPAFFALNLTGASYRDIADRRLPLARAVLGELGLLSSAGG